jgi:hypothetical protein
MRDVQWKSVTHLLESLTSYTGYQHLNLAIRISESLQIERGKSRRISAEKLYHISQRLYMFFLLTFINPPL